MTEYERDGYGTDDGNCKFKGVLGKYIQILADEGRKLISDFRWAELLISIFYNLFIDALSITSPILEHSTKTQGIILASWELFNQGWEHVQHWHLINYLVSITGSYYVNNASLLSDRRQWRNFRLHKAFSGRYNDYHEFLQQITNWSDKSQGYLFHVWYGSYSSMDCCISLLSNIHPCAETWPASYRSEK